MYCRIKYSDTGCILMEEDDIIIEINLRKVGYLLVIIVIVGGLVYYDRVKDSLVYRSHLRELEELGFDIRDEFSWWLYEAGHPDGFNVYHKLKWSEFREKCLLYREEEDLQIFIDDTIKTIWFRISVDEYSGEIFRYDARSG